MSGSFEDIAPGTILLRQRDHGGPQVMAPTVPETEETEVISQPLEGVALVPHPLGARAYAPSVGVGRRQGVHEGTKLLAHGLAHQTTKVLLVGMTEEAFLEELEEVIGYSLSDLANMGGSTRAQISSAVLLCEAEQLLAMKAGSAKIRKAFEDLKGTNIRIY